MRIFISWSGERSKQLAKLLHEWLPLISERFEPWFSDEDIRAGGRWSIELSRQLAEANFGIICLTPENLQSEWILFEAGALSKSLRKGVIIPILLDIDFSEVSGPLSSFQAKKLDEKSIYDVAVTISDELDDPVAPDTLTRRFEAFWPDFQEGIQEIAEVGEERKPIRPTEEILEDLVSTVRSLERGMRGLEERLFLYDFIEEPPDRDEYVDKLYERFAQLEERINQLAPSSRSSNTKSETDEFGPEEIPF